MIEALEFRKTMGRFATGVMVATAHWQGGDYGITINSFTSLSLYPPLVLFCLDHKVGSLAAFQAAPIFGLSILAAGQEDVSGHFASKGERQWADHGFIRDTTHAVYLQQNALAQIICRKVNEFPGGDHQIIIGEVMAVNTSEAGAPLLYYAGQYRKCSN